MYHRIYNTAESAMTAAYELSASSGKVVWRHIFRNKNGAIRWLVTHEENTQIALQGLTP